MTDTLFALQSARATQYFAQYRLPACLSFLPSPPVNEKNHDKEAFVSCCHSVSRAKRAEFTFAVILPFATSGDVSALEFHVY